MNDAKAAPNDADRKMQARRVFAVQRIARAKSKTSEDDVTCGID